MLAYVLTADRDIFPGDPPEFIAVSLTGGVAHPPGYPLFSMLGALFGQLPLGPLPFRVNLIAALAHAATLGVVFLTAERLTRDLVAAAAAALILAFGALFWTWSLVAEVFPLNDLLAALVLYFLVVWHARPSGRAPLLAAAAAFGLRLAHLWQAVGLGAALAILPYAYIPIASGRHELLNWGSVQTVGDLARQLLRLDYGTGQLIPVQAYQGGTAFDRLGDFAKNVNPLLALLVVFGAVQAYRRVRWYFWTAALAFIFSGLLFVAYANANVAVATARFVLVRFYLLPQVAVAPVAAFGVVYLVELARRRSVIPRRWLRTAVAGAVCVLAASEIVLTFQAVDLADDHVAHDFAIDLLATTPPNVVLLTGGDHVALPLAYVQSVEQAGPDVTLVFIPVLSQDWYQRELKLRHPEINVPLARYDQPDGLRIFMQANLGRTFYLTGEQADQTFGGFYGIYGRGLLLPVIGPDAQIDVKDVVNENERLLASYHIPSLATIKQESMERFILDWYALVPFRLGLQFENSKLYADARSWYQRALAIDPELFEALAGMRRVQGR